MRLSNVAWNLLGLASPLVIAALTIPALIELIGLERFGLLALAWGLIGYAGVFDLGIGRATTQLLAQLRGQSALADIPFVIQTATRLTLLTGTIGFLFLTLAAVSGVANLIRHSADLSSEINVSVFLLALAVPVQAISATYRGVNEAFEKFRGISLLRMGLGVLNFLGPYWVAHFSNSLVWLVAILLISRITALVIFRFLAIRCVNTSLGCSSALCASVRRDEIKKQLFVFGGWVTVSSVAGPLLVQADRFVIGGLISAAAVAAYTIPYEVVVQSLVVVGAVSSVVFPSLAKQMHQDPLQWQLLFRRWLFAVIGVMLVVTVTLALLLPSLLPFWIGKNLPDESVVIGQILCLGVFANSIGSMYFSLLHAKGRSDITAKLHLIELPIFIGLLFFLINIYGLYGVAWAWVGRTVFDAILLKILSNH
ncbi:oligosaccharide flippase family protein [Rhodoferax sp.]|uniref:oligosaccharide flippase family protein n=1 Tax=Rhodoferax sp. TaxID=50421 RepID=UPI002617C684|nr:oligosaccharide flippase family protein [Rhodoferax sp.]MDD4960471.1 oligosaccharide flippase family protein [Gallionella sp.]MDD5481246.1 oligosaccharide flippase family protein [Rhodoferax sp.]